MGETGRTPAALPIGSDFERLSDGPIGDDSIIETEKLRTQLSWSMIDGPNHTLVVTTGHNSSLSSGFRRQCIFTTSYSHIYNLVRVSPVD